MFARVFGFSHACWTLDVLNMSRDRGQAQPAALWAYVLLEVNQNPSAHILPTVNAVTLRDAVVARCINRAISATKHRCPHCRKPLGGWGRKKKKQNDALCRLADIARAKEQAGESWKEEDPAEAAALAARQAAEEAQPGELLQELRSMETAEQRNYRLAREAEIKATEEFLAREATQSASNNPFARVSEPRPPLSQVGASQQNTSLKRPLDEAVGIGGPAMKKASKGSLTPNVASQGSEETPTQKPVAKKNAFAMLRQYTSTVFPTHANAVSFWQGHCSEEECSWAAGGSFQGAGSR